ncbi:Nitrite-sensitive transcriptional repressor NsrR [hydrothermal vent metagenome]|uniref:Nitrite-sensitive transcriptional repressor NsrR n=1 Tax=hydrothermal vent metagenome TaxID=652676 RepID=A0A3B0WU54_9ZZZZ
MQLTHYTDYSLRVLIFLSLQKNGTRTTITDISEQFNISRNHLVKVVHKLGKLNYIKTTRGKHGGLFLNQQTNHIRLGDVISKVENTLNIIDCEAPSPCPIAIKCKLKSILQTATDQFIESLNQYTIADLQEEPDQLRVLLKIT